MKALLLALTLLADGGAPASDGWPWNIGKSAPPKAEAAAPSAPSAAEAAAQPFHCPEGTEPHGAAPPEGFEVWCERPGEKEHRREGPVRTWYDDGGLSRIDTFKDGKREGPFAEWYRGGKPARVGQHHSDARDGLWRFWFENGLPQETCSYVDGKRHGPFATFWPNGKRRVEGRYCYDLQCGAWISWDEAGHELGKMQYEEIRGTP